jgi:hypothetical protein
MNSWTFMIEQLSNGSWIVGWLQGHNDYGRVMSDRAGFATYAEAEKHALAKLREVMRKQRDDWANASKLAARLKQKQTMCVPT